MVIHLQFKEKSMCNQYRKRRIDECEKKHIVLCCIGAVLLSLIVLVAAKIVADNQKYNVKGDIKAVDVSSSVDGLVGCPKKTSDNKKISVLLDCIKKVQLNNKYRIRDIEQAPIFYEITFFFNDGKSETYQYTVYPAEAYNNPFESFYKLFNLDE